MAEAVQALVSNGWIENVPMLHFVKQQVLRTWRWACALLGVEALNLLPGGSRVSGARGRFLVHTDTPLLQRRGRWVTRERYVQEKKISLANRRQAAAACKVLQILAPAKTILGCSR